MRLTATLAVLLLTTTVSVSAADEKAPVDKKDKVICRTDKMTGSRTRVRRTCMTRAQWDDLAAKTKKGLDEFNGSAAGGTNSAWNPSNGPG
ncbi:MAG: hypothetical protein P0Y56_02190 [Candidatus Andeanibacterium colombiense]|uniref:Uncharacterized protein n=1 Tax=Candidatus Andeanibacterium colombiense TaxID=3121345 RepID=A0AAJ5X9I4_9SPHN|nr:MAG: hypothetical protein P0Y56_02190 [Sphingomonadaceae bacterium]